MTPARVNVALSADLDAAFSAARGLNFSPGEFMHAVHEGVQREQRTVAVVRQVSWHLGNPSVGLRDVTLRLERGEVCALAGDRAATYALTRLLLGRLEPLSGSVRVFGVDPAVAPPALLDTRVGYFLQWEYLYPPLPFTVLLNAAQEGLEKWDEPYARWLGARMGLRYVAGCEVGAFRLGLVMALARHPELLVLDLHSCRFLGSELRSVILEEIGRAARDDDAAVLFSTSDPDEAWLGSDRSVWLESGRIIFTYPPAGRGG
jgi:ABC-type multidrug transport system ATPase subunit